MQKIIVQAHLVFEINWGGGGGAICPPSCEIGCSNSPYKIGLNDRSYFDFTQQPNKAHFETNFGVNFMNFRREL